MLHSYIKRVAFQNHIPIPIELDLSNYVITFDQRNSKGVLKADFASLKSDVVKLEIDKLEGVPMI